MFNYLIKIYILERVEILKNINFNLYLEIFFFVIIFLKYNLKFMKFLKPKSKIKFYKFEFFLIKFCYTEKLFKKKKL